MRNFCNREPEFYKNTKRECFQLQPRSGEHSFFRNIYHRA